MTVVERKPVPVYEVVCSECGSRIQYTAAEVSFTTITCPVCGVMNFVNTIRPVRMEETDESGQGD